MKEKERGITIIGHVGHGKSALVSELASKVMNETGLKVIIAPEPTKEPDLTINGIDYEEIVLHNRPSRKYMVEIAMLANMFSLGNQHNKARPNVNIITEFALIQQKKSNLSRSERELVVSQFNRRFKKIEP